MNAIFKYKTLVSIFIVILLPNIIFSYTVMKQTDGAGTYNNYTAVTPNYGNSRTQFVHWQNELIVGYYVNSNGAGDGITWQQTYSAVSAGFQEWAAAPGSYLSFNGLDSTTSKINASDDKNVFYWAESHSESAYVDWRLTYLTLGMTIYTINAQQELLDVDIIMNGVDFNWNVDGSDYDIQAVATHEIGHMIGLGDLIFCPFPPQYLPTMCKPYFGIEQRTIELDDDMGIAFLYNKTIYVPGTIAGDFPLLAAALNETVPNSAQTVIAKQDIHELANDAIVKIGTTLKITEGATLKFGPINKSGDSESKSSLPGLIVQGNLLISPHRVTTTFEPSGGAVEWSGIHFESTANNNSSLINASIDKAQYGIYLDSAEPTLEDLSITNSGTGVYIKNSSPIMDELDISNCINGVYVTNSSPIIKNSTLNYNSYGIRVYNSYTSPNWNVKHIYNNNINNNSSYGLYLYNSSPTFSNNYIQSNRNGTVLWYNCNPIFEENKFQSSQYYGLACYGSASPNLNYNSSYNFGGYNIITTNGDKGVKITGSSYPNLGEPSLSLGGFNSIMENTGYEIWNTTSSMIFACNNWWGSSSGPQSSDFYGSVRWIPYLDYDPNPQNKTNNGIPPFSYDETSILPISLQLAFYYQNIQEYESSANKFKDYFSSNFNDSFNSLAAVQFVKSLLSYREIYQCIAEIESAIKKDLDDAVKFELLSANALLETKLGNIDAALTVLVQAEKLEISSEQLEMILSQKGIIYTYYLNEIEKGKSFFEEVLRNNSKDSPWYEFASEELKNINVDIYDLPKQANYHEAFKTPDSYRLFVNYPNPFNPSTNIKYQIKEPGFVSLKVYDILGREASVLVNERKEAGLYEIFFNANELSSGLYIYTLRVNNYVASKKMLLTK